MLCLLACDVEPIRSSDAPDDEYRDGASPFSAEDLYLALRDVTNAYPLPEPTQVIEVGTFNPATGDFQGLQSIPGGYDPEFGIVMPEIPAGAGISAVRAILRFRAVGNAAMWVNVNGVNRYKASGVSHLDIDVGHATHVDLVGEPLVPELQRRAVDRTAGCRRSGGVRGRGMAGRLAV
jgi:hypothetical protein